MTVCIENDSIYYEEKFQIIQFFETNTIFHWNSKNYKSNNNNNSNNSKKNNNNNDKNN